MPISPTTPSIAGPSAGYGATGTDTNQAFREADFMKILLAEVTQQDPFKPQETAKIVEGMQKLQELANSRFEKFRDDQRWARDLIGNQITVQQTQHSTDEVQTLREKGLNPDVGYQSVSGVVERYRIVDETVWLSVGGKDYPIDNVRQIDPPAQDGGILATTASSMLGHLVRYRSEDGASMQEGLATSVGFGSSGGIEITIGTDRVPLSRIERVSLPY